MEPNHNIIIHNLINSNNKRHRSPTSAYINNNNNNNNNNNKTNADSHATSFTNAASPPTRSHGYVTTQACAACKYQRRKCVSDCILAPYFPHDRQRQFLNAHRLFGVSNIIKIIKNLEQPAKDNAMRTIIFQAEARAADPVGGCYHIIRGLEHRISLAKAELEIVLHHLAMCRAADVGSRQPAVQLPQTPDNGDSTINGDPFGYYCNERWRGQYTADDEVAAAAVVEEVDSWGGMHGVVDNGNMHAHAESSSSSFQHYNHNYHHHHHQQHDNHVMKLSMESCENAIKPILLSYDDEGEFKFDSHGNIIPSQNTVQSEEKSRFKEDEDSCFQYIDDHNDLKTAATFFSLTNYDI